MAVQLLVLVIGSAARLARRRRRRRRYITECTMHMPSGTQQQ